MNKKEIKARIKMIQENLKAGPLPGMDKAACKKDAHKDIGEYTQMLRGTR